MIAFTLISVYLLAFIPEAWAVISLGTLLGVGALESIHLGLEKITPSSFLN